MDLSFLREVSKRKKNQSEMKQNRQRIKNNRGGKERKEKKLRRRGKKLEEGKEKGCLSWGHSRVLPSFGLMC